MEIEAGAPMYQAVVERVFSTFNTVEVFVRFRRSRLFEDKKKSFTIIVHRNDSHNTQKAYETLKRMRPGDAIYVDGYGQEWDNPRRHNGIRRWWNVHFA